jgi:hypothetical protein
MITPSADMMSGIAKTQKTTTSALSVMAPPP